MLEHDKTKIEYTTDPEQWVDVHGDPLFRYALARLRNRTEAEDVVQATFLAALEARESYSGRSSFRTWLFGILKHKIADKMRESTRARALAGPDESVYDLSDLFAECGHHRILPAAWKGDSRAVLERNEFFDCLRACLSGMPGRLSAVFELREIEGMSRDDILSLMQIKPNNYWVMLHRARLLLRACIETNWFGRPAKENN